MNPREQAMALTVLNEVQAKSEAEDGDLVHVMLCWDPMVGKWTARGPYPDGASAMLAIERWKRELAPAVEPGEPEFEFTVCPLFTVDGDETPPR